MTRLPTPAADAAASPSFTARSLALSATLVVAAAAAMSAVPALAEPVAPVATATAAAAGMRVLAIERSAPPLSPQALKKILPQEMSATLRLYLDGKIDGWYQRKDHPGVVFILNAASVEEAQALLDSLPLGRAGKLSFDLIPIGPLGPLATLLLPASPPP